MPDLSRSVVIALVMMPALCSFVSAQLIDLPTEAEPNNSAATATPVTALRTHIQGQLPVEGDQDWYAFEAPVGARVYAATMTGSSNPSSSDTLLHLFAPDGVTEIEVDDDDGSYSSTSSSISGATLTQGGRHYLRVDAFGTSRVIPYELYLAVRTDVIQTETEPNNFSADGTPLIGPFPEATGTISTPTDQDWWRFHMSAGDTIFLSLDLDPDRDGVEFDGRVAFFPSPSDITVNTGLRPNDGGKPGPDSEALFCTVSQNGIFNIAVDAVSGTGAYRLAATVFPRGFYDGGGKSQGFTYAIPGDPSYTELTIIASGGAFPIADLDVEFWVTHEHFEDLDVYLRAPSGNVVVLFTDQVHNALPARFIFDDEAALPMNSDSGLTECRLKPENTCRLSWFDGENPNGAWTLSIIDDAPGAAGVVQRFAVSWASDFGPAVPHGYHLEAVHSADFETASEGYTHSGTADSWQRGVAANFPISGAGTGSNCWETNLITNYSANSNQDLVSPSISLAGLTPPLFLTWDHALQMESSMWDHAWVSVRPVGGGAERHVWDWRGPTMADTVGQTDVTIHECAGWGRHHADISDFLGQNVQIVFHLDSDGSNQFDGFGIDTVRVLHSVPATTANVVDHLLGLLTSANPVNDFDFSGDNTVDAADVVRSMTVQP